MTSSDNQQKNGPARKMRTYSSAQTNNTARRGKPRVAQRGATRRPISTDTSAGSRTKKTNRPSRNGGRNAQRKNNNRRPPANTAPPKNRKSAPIPDLAPEVVRVIPLGGVEEIGRNITAIEYGDDIIVVDCGFMFKEEDTPGVDYILPNTQYLEERKEKIRGVIITHGHLDHIGGIPYIMDLIGNPPIYTRRLTSVMVKKRQEEFPHLPELDLREIEGNETVRLGSLPVTFFAVTHTIPDAMGVIVKTPQGNVVVTGDIKLNHVDGVPTKEEQDSFAVFKNDQPLLLLMDSTNTERPGWSIPETTVFDTFEKLIAKKTRGRMIIGTFASQLERVMRIISIAEKNGKKVIIEGRSMKTNVAIAQEIGLLKTKEDTLIPIEAMGDYPKSKILILATGAQGDAFAALMRIANKAHKHIHLTNDDTVILSSSVIPGNERAVQKLKDNLSRQGAHIITYQTSDVHASGHGNREEAKWVHQQINPKFFIPQHGYHYMLRVHADLVRESIGLPDDHIIIPDNGSIIEIRDGGTKMVRLPVKAPIHTRVVEGQVVTNIQTTVIRDRQMLAEEGIFVIVATINPKTGKMRKSPDIISRGFIYLRESQELLQQTRLIVKKSVETASKKSYPIDIDHVKESLVTSVTKFLATKTNKRPIVIPVIVSI